MKRKIEMVLKDVKKGSVRYDAKSDEVDPIVTNIYAMKVGFPGLGEYPKAVTVTVEWEG